MMLVFITDGLPPIPKKIVAKILNGEYVDLAELLPRKPLWRIMPSLKLLKEWSYQRKPNRKVSKRVIQDIPLWMEAFMIFVAVQSIKYPEQTSDLLAYGTIILKGAREYQGQGWLPMIFSFAVWLLLRGRLQIGA